VVGAYRDNEVDDSHPLMEFVNYRGPRSMQLHLLKINELKKHDLKTLLSDTLRTNKGIQKLVEIVFEKTRGNPFFFRRLLSSLSEEGRIGYDPEVNSWNWNIDDIKSVKIADNVADLLGNNIARFPEKLKNLLTLAACLGNRFDLQTLSMISGMEEQELSILFITYLGGEYVVELNNTFEFVHDQVQQSAYYLIDANSRKEKHLGIGRMLLSKTKETELDEKIFDIVNQYNQGVTLLRDPNEKIQLAKLNLAAGRKAKLSSAFLTAAEYFRHSVALLGDNKWDDHYDLTRQVYNELIQACYLTIQNEEVRLLFDTILNHAKNNVDATAAYKTMIMSNIAQNELLDAIALAEGFLASLNVSFDTSLDADLTTDELRALPPSENEEKMAALEILLAVDTPFIYAMPERIPTLIFTMLNIIGKYGHSYVSGPAYTWHAFFLCFGQQYQQGNNFGRLGVDLLKEYPYPGMASKIMDFQYAYLLHWEVPVHDLIAPLKDYYHVGMQEGNFEWGLYCLFNHTILLWSTGKPLEDCLKEVELSIEICESKNHEITLPMFLMYAESTSNLMGGSANTTQLEGKYFSEEKMYSKLSGNDMLLALFELIKITHNYLFGDVMEAYQCVDKLLKYRASLNPHYLYTRISFYGSLSCIGSPAEFENDAERQDRLKKLELFEQELKLWAETAPMNYQHQYDLVMAEKARVTDEKWKAVKHYEAAITGAKENLFIHDEALACELFGKFWLEQGNVTIAKTYIRQAQLLYHRWGAGAKVHHLEKCYPQCFRSEPIPDRKPDIPVDAGKIQTTTNGSITPIQLDIESIVSASQLLSSETDFEQLLSKLMKLVMASSGADKAILMLKLENEWSIQAQGDVKHEKSKILLNKPFNPESIEDSNFPVPASVFEYCQRMQENLVVGDVQSDQRFSHDRVLQEHHIRSLACIKIVSQGEIRGRLYLENSQMADVFTLERIEILNHLASQFAISTENALLYERLNQKINALQESETRFRLVFENANEAIAVTQDEVVKYCNPQITELTGYSIKEVYSMQFSEFIHPEDLEILMHEYRARLSGEKPRSSYTVRIITKGGQEKFVFINSAAVDWDSRPATIALLTDITELKIAESELLKSEERFRHLMEQSPLAMEILSPDGKILVVNSAWKKLWQVSDKEAAETLDKYNMRTDPQLERLGVIEEVQEAFKGKHTILPPIQYDTGQTAVDFDIKLLKDFNSPWIQSHLNSVKDVKGEIIYIVNTYVDLTTLMKAEQEAQEQRDVLARIDRASSMGQLTGSIAHELNQPLTGILGNAQAAELMFKSGNWKVEEFKEILTDIINDTKRGGEVIRNLRELYRDQKVEFNPFDINEIINDTVQLLHSELVMQHVMINVKSDSSIPTLKGNKIQIQQVLVNLIMNGIQAMKKNDRDNRQIQIQTTYNDNEIRTFVADYGIGIDPDKIDRIFEPLATWKPGGTGMGLAISNSIVKSHGGRMWAENRPEGGALVGFALPLIKLDFKKNE